jgi:hypothetical protein
MQTLSAKTELAHLTKQWCPCNITSALWIYHEFLGCEEGNGPKVAVETVGRPRSSLGCEPAQTPRIVKPATVPIFRLILKWLDRLEVNLVSCWYRIKIRLIGSFDGRLSICAISHVWSDGMNDSALKSLPAHQLVVHF